MASPKSASSKTTAKSGRTGGSIIGLLRQTVSEWNEDQAPMLGAALSYYTVFSLAPLLIIVIACAGVFLGNEAVQGKVIEQISGLIGEQGAKAVSEMIESAYKSQDGLVATIVGVIGLLFGATGVMIQLQLALDTVWDVRRVESEGVVGFFRNRWLSFTMIVGIGFLLLVSLFASAAISFFARYSIAYLPFSAFLLQVVNVAASIALTTVLFAVMFRYLPNVRVHWSEVWMGALASAVLFTVGKQLIGLYLGRAAVTSSFGAAGSLAIILLWSYYSAQILLFGAEFTQVYARSRNREPEPKPGFARLADSPSAD
ncbi:MAG: YihY/virulence factor BrkB family protein [Bdellovibrionota bacterium]